MKRTPALLLGALLLAFPAADAAGKRTVTLLHVSDTHSHLAPTGPRNADLTGTVGGIAKATTVIMRTKAAHPETLLLHAGDLFQGDVFFNYALGVPELQWMLDVGFDAMAVGNHDFDLGPENLAGILATAFPRRAVPLLSSNASGLAEVGLDGFVTPGLVKQAGDVKVGVFGLTVPDEPLCQSAPVVLDLDLAGVARSQVSALRRRGAEVVVLLSHLGLARDAELARAVEGLDVIIGAHDHAGLEKPIVVRQGGGQRTLLVESGPYYAHVGKLELEVVKAGVKLVDYELVPLDAKVRPEPSVEAAVNGLVAEIEAALGPVFSSQVGLAAGDFAAVPPVSGPFRDAPIGNLVTDAFRAAGATDLALTTVGLLSEGISHGPLVPADLFRVVSYGLDPTTGYGFGLVTCDITGAELAEGLEIAVAGAGVEDPFFPQVSGVTFAFSSARPVGERVALESITVAGEPLDPARTYTMTVNSIVPVFFEMLGVAVTDVAPVEGAYEFTALLGYVMALGGDVNPCSEGRVVDTAGSAGASSRPRIRFPGR